MSKFGIAYIVIASSIHSAIVMLAAELRPCLVEGPRQQLVRHILSIALTLVAIWLAGLGDKTLIDDQYNVDLRQRIGPGLRLR